MSGSILIVDDEENARHHIYTFLSSKGYEVYAVASLTEARDCIIRGCADIILLDVQLPDGYGPVLLKETTHLLNRPPIIVITGHGDIEMAVEVMRDGALDFLTKPIRLFQLEESIQRAQEIVSMRRELAEVHRSLHKNNDFIIGETTVMKRIFEEAQRASAASVSVLITGETGTGKEVLANTIHSSGPRANKPFMAINSAAIQPTMLESELFGYEAGAFTGAEKRKPGLMEVADNGILFLDEISSMSVDTQVKLLRAIEENAFRRVGGTNLIKVDVQILAASNRNIPALINEGRFREDLFYRLKVVDIHMPALREHSQDIPELVGLFIRKSNLRMGKNVTDITQRALECLMKHKWPGNIRELRNVIERAMLFCDDSYIDVCHLPLDIMDYSK